jgi:cytoskeletal protein CcmA (bactofilin family)
MAEDPKTPENGAAPEGAAAAQKSDKSATELMGQINESSDQLSGPPKSSIDAMADQSNAEAANGPVAKKPEAKGFKKLLGKFNIYLLLFILIIVVVGAVFGITYAMSKKQDDIKISTQKLTDETLEKLKTSDAVVGDPKQILTVESNMLVTGKVVLKDSLDVAGALKIGGALSIPTIRAAGAGDFGSLSTNDFQAAGNTAIGGLLDVVGATTLGSNLSVKGDINGGGKLDIKGNGTIGGSFTVNGTLSAKALNFGDITFAHINIAGGTPGIAVGGGAGGGGTASLSGNDAGGTATINTGGGPSASILATITFATAYNSANPHPVISPNGPGCAGISYYVTNVSATQFAIASASVPPSGATCRFNYVVVN